jgi:hypothetical protein
MKLYLVVIENGDEGSTVYENKAFPSISDASAALERAMKAFRDDLVDLINENQSPNMSPDEYAQLRDYYEPEPGGVIGGPSFGILPSETEVGKEICVMHIPDEETVGYVSVIYSA